MLANYVSSLRGLPGGKAVGPNGKHSHGNGRILMLFFVGFLVCVLKSFLIIFFYCTPHGQNRKRDVLMHVTLTII